MGKRPYRYALFPCQECCKHIQDVTFWAIVSSLAAGEERIIKADGSKMTMTIGGGFVEMLNNEVSLLVSGVKG